MYIWYVLLYVYIYSINMKARAALLFPASTALLPFLTLDPRCDGGMLRPVRWQHRAHALDESMTIILLLESAWTRKYFLALNNLFFLRPVGKLRVFVMNFAVC